MLFFIFSLVCAGAGARAGAGAGAGALYVALDENLGFWIEVEADQEYLVNCVKILSLGDAGEVVIVSFFISVMKIMRIIGIIDKGKVEAQDTQLLVMPENIH